MLFHRAPMEKFALELISSIIQSFIVTSTLIFISCDRPLTAMRVSAEDPFLPKEVSPEVDKIQGGLREVIPGASSGISHPRGSLFDDDVIGLEETGLEDTQDTNDQGPRLGNLVASGSVGSPPQRVVSKVGLPQRDVFHPSLLHHDVRTRKSCV